MAKLHLLKKKSKKKEEPKPAPVEEFSLFKMGKKFADMVGATKKNNKKKK